MFCSVQQAGCRGGLVLFVPRTAIRILGVKAEEIPGMLRESLVPDTLDAHAQRGLSLSDPLEPDRI
jgi:hypothetical protein